MNIYHKIRKIMYKKEIERIIRKEIKDFMDSTQANKIVVKMIQDLTVIVKPN